MTLSRRPRPPHVLVAYATKHGSTREIADTIGETLHDEGLSVDVRAAGGMLDIDRYGAVVLGSALYSAHWQRDANRFVRRHLVALRERPVWLFSSGPLDHSAELADIPLTEHVARDVAPIEARGHRTFGGRLLPGTPGVDEALLSTHHIGDFRDWEAIRAWAQEIAADLLNADPPDDADG
jgi:menaquinone-dependent protoporphyrinogen oxidase